MLKCQREIKRASSLYPTAASITEWCCVISSCEVGNGVSKLSRLYHVGAWVMLQHQGRVTYAASGQLGAVQRWIQFSTGASECDELSICLPFNLT